MRIDYAGNGYTAREIRISDLYWLCETMEDFPMFGGFSISRCQGELSEMRQVFRKGLGATVVVSHDGDPVGFYTLTRDTPESVKGLTALQATHPDYRQQGHGRWVNMFRGYHAFHMMELQSFVYQRHLTNGAVKGLARQWDTLTARNALETRDSKHETDKLVSEHLISAQDWVDYLDANPDYDMNAFTHID